LTTERGDSGGRIFHAAMFNVSLIVFYFSAAPQLQWMDRPDAFSPAKLKRRKQEVLDCFRHGLFDSPNFPLP
jgi:hypothetical protein